MTNILGVIEQRRNRMKLLTEAIQHISSIAKSMTNMQKRERLVDWCDLFNALLLPLAFVGVDSAGFVHVTIIETQKRARDLMKSGGWSEMSFLPDMTHCTDVVWCLEPSGRYVMLRDRCGKFVRSRQCKIVLDSGKIG